MICLIPARAGSKRLPHKNTLPFCGLPLYLWSVATAKRLGLAPVVSTDDETILRECPYAVRRPALFCQDDSSTQSFVEPLLVEYRAICLLQPTSPTRPDSLVLYMLGRRDACRSVTNGSPNGQCYIYRAGQAMGDVETEQGHDIDTLEQFNAAERDMLRRFQ